MWLAAVVGCARHAPVEPGVAAREPEVAPASVAEPEPAAEPAPEPAEPARDLVDVAVPREFRGMWVATVSNLDFPSRRGLSAEDAQTELAAIAEGARMHGLNALVFQVRPEGDAFYASDLEPWSRFLTGTQGVDPGFDPLQTLIDEAHARGIEVHAWFNPYRAAASGGAALAENHVANRAEGAVCRWGSVLWLDPGAVDVRRHTLAVIDDVMTRYDIDGVHLDDYFYPYPDGTRSFPDQASYAAYCDGGGTLDRSAWRRENVDTLVREIADRVTERRPDCRFGISPFGLYRPGQPEGTRGLDQYTALNADPMLWYSEGWIDYLAPQLYWSMKREGQRYDKLLSWWNERVEPERPLLVGLDVTKVGNEAEWTLDEIRTQVTLSRAADRTAGQIWFRATPILKDQAGVGALLTELYATPALPPPTPGWVETGALPPQLVVEPAGVTIVDPDPASVRAFVLYEVVDGGITPKRILVPGTNHVLLPSGTWAISAVRRGAVESRGVRFTVP